MQSLAQGRSLRARGHEATIITLHYDRSWPRREMIEGVPVIRVAGMLLGGREKLPRLLQQSLYLMAMLVIAWKLWQHRQYYDVLHVYQLNLLALPTAMVCWLTNKPMIVAVRSAESVIAGGFDKKVSLVAGLLDVNVPCLQVDGRVEEQGDLYGLERLGKLVVRFTRSLLLSIHAVIIVLSSRMVSYLTAHDFNLPGMQLIPNGVDITRFIPLHDAVPIEERARVVVCVAKLRYEKGIDVLLQAWRLVQQQLPESRLILVGDGPIERQLRCLAEALDIQESVEFAGLQQDIPAQLHRGSLAVLPSRFEGMPNAILEAMACGLPCVATRVSGSEDVVQHGINGLLVENEDYRGMAQALLLLLQDQELTRKYGSAARETIEKHYSLEHITDRYIEIYQNITDHRHQRARDNTFSPLPVVSMYRGKDTGQCAE